MTVVALNFHCFSTGKVHKSNEPVSEEKVQSSTTHGLPYLYVKNAVTGYNEYCPGVWAAGETVKIRNYNLVYCVR